MGAPVVLAEGPERQQLARETTWVMVAFLYPAVVSAVVQLAQHASGVGTEQRFPDIVSGRVLNLVLGIVTYAGVAVVVPLALFLLARSGQHPRDLGIGITGVSGDLLPALGLAGAGYLGALAVSLVLSPLRQLDAGLFSSPGVGGVPAYYVIWGIALSAITAVSEEVLVNGYLITRLGQLGWSPGRALALSLVLRTSYHVYYGVGFLVTIPFGYFVTRSFQKRRRLDRSILAHFVYDAVLTTIAILA